MRLWIALFLVASAALAGCADEPQSTEECPEGDPDCDVAKPKVTDDTGGIRGVVVDDAIVPVVEAQVVLTVAGETREATTDDQGRFTFDTVEPGTHFLRVSKYGHEEVQVSTAVEAGVEDPPVVKIQLPRLSTEDPFTQPFQFTGHVVCSYSASLVVTGITAPCITDYTSIVCPGGCAPQLREVQGDTRDWEWAIEDGWQTHQIEMTWEPSAQGTSNQMGFTVSHTERTATHWYATFGGEAPVVGRIDCCSAHPSNQGDPSAIPPEGIPNLVSFVNVRGSGVADVAIEQDFSIFQHTFYNLQAPEGWSFLGGDDVPF